MYILWCSYSVVETDASVSVSAARKGFQLLQSTSVLPLHAAQVVICNTDMAIHLEKKIDDLLDDRRDTLCIIPALYFFLYTSKTRANAKYGK